MSSKISKELSNHRLEQAKEELEDAKLLYDNKRYKSSNNRAYYAIFHAVRAVLALEKVDFKRHKDVIGYFNQHYVKTEIFPKMISKKIAQASKIREDSDYDDQYLPDAGKTKIQIDIAKEIIELVEQYIKNH